MTSLQSLYQQLRAQAFQDPIIRSLAQGTISWADVFTEADEKRHQEYASGEGAEILEAVRREMGPVKKTRVQWADEEKKPSPSLQIITTSVLFNPNQIKTIVVRNLPRDVVVDELKSVFEKHGPLRDLYIPKNLDKNSPYYGTIKGFALIKYLSHTDSTRAFLAEQSTLFLRGKQMSLEFAKEDR